MTPAEHKAEIKRVNAVTRWMIISARKIEEGSVVRFLGNDNQYRVTGFTSGGMVKLTDRALNNSEWFLITERNDPIKLVLYTGE
jgi:hypothetical protein